MTQNQYRAVTDYFRKKPVRRTFLFICCKILPVVTVVIYAGLLAVLLWTKSVSLIRTTVVPAAVLILVTVFRAWLNLPRPYDKLEFLPVFSVEYGKGQSFPSRHTASAWIIACACWYHWVPLGIVMGLLALLISLSRIAAGVHYPKDVIGAFLISLLFGLAGFWII